MTDILTLCTELAEEQFRAGDLLLTEGDTAAQLFVLLEGTVSVTKNGAEVARISEPGAVFGEMSALLDAPVTATVTARTDVRAHVCAEPLAFMERNPEFALHTARLLALRLQNATTYLADLKRQFEDRSDHFGMMDQILGAMVEQQPRVRLQTRKTDDPRL